VAVVRWLDGDGWLCGVVRRWGRGGGVDERWCGCDGCGVEMAAKVVMAADAMEMKVGMMEMVSAM
ncbi:hypothetical protein Tco_0139616, partial [Tanacetum coccineum]